jgi:hypothetical protein
VAYIRFTSILLDKKPAPSHGDSSRREGAAVTSRPGGTESMRYEAQYGMGAAEAGALVKVEQGRVTADQFGHRTLRTRGRPD